MNPKHKGPHCNGLCEGQAYLTKIKALEADLDRWRRGYNNMTVDSKNEEIDALSKQAATLELNVNKRVWYQKGYNRGLERAMMIVSDSHYGWQHELDEIVDELRKEIKRDSN